MSNLYDREIVAQMPVNTIQELTEKEKVEDYNMLLNETWEHYARRTGKCNDFEEYGLGKRVKWVNETWDEYEQRKICQKKYIATKMRELETRWEQEKVERSTRDTKSAEVIDMLMKKNQKQQQELATPCRHYLFIDFYELQQQKFSAERLIVINAESMIRHYIEDGMELLAELFDCYHNNKLQINRQMEMERQMAEEEKRKQLEEEARLRQIKEERLQKERERHEEERLRRAREEAELNKRLERRRRDEERRARVRGAGAVEQITEKQ